jgi:hypothetical protein
MANPRIIKYNGFIINESNAGIAVKGSIEICRKTYCKFIKSKGEYISETINLEVYITQIIIPKNKPLLSALLE